MSRLSTVRSTVRSAVPSTATSPAAWTVTPADVASPIPIPLSRLRCDRRADRRVVRALLAHIRRCGLYPPLIVTPAPDCPGRYEIIDGAARAEALARLGAQQAHCEVWPVEPSELPLLGLAFRRIHGRQDVAGQLPTLRRLADAMPAAELATLLGGTPRALRRQLEAMESPPRPVAPARELSLTPVVFHLDAAGHRRLELALQGLAGRETSTAEGGCATPTRSRGELLMTLLEGTNHG